LQNIPIQTAQGRRVRAAFIAPPGKVLISADYSQIELRVLAHLSGDENLCQAFRDGVDIHARTAREILGLAPDDELTPELRRIGKTINFGIVYGMSSFRLSRDLGIPVSVAKEYIDGYFAKFPRVQSFFHDLEEQAVAKGYVETLFGRKRFLSHIDVQGRDRGFLLRAALNAPIQGSAADLIKLAMLQVSRAIESGDLPATLLLQIHDELLFEAPAEVADGCMAKIQVLMESVAELNIPLLASVRKGRTWEEAH
jgi:DNA polymerase-1